MVGLTGFEPHFTRDLAHEQVSSDYEPDEVYLLRAPTQGLGHGQSQGASVTPFRLIPLSGLDSQIDLFDERLQPSSKGLLFFC